METVNPLLKHAFGSYVKHVRKKIFQDTSKTTDIFLPVYVLRDKKSVKDGSKLLLQCIQCQLNVAFAFSFLWETAPSDMFVDRCVFKKKEIVNKYLVNYSPSVLKEGTVHSYKEVTLWPLEHSVLFTDKQAAEHPVC